MPDPKFLAGQVVAVRNITPDATGNVSAYCDGVYLVLGDEIGGFINVMKFESAPKGESYWHGGEARNIDTNKMLAEYVRDVSPDEIAALIDSIYAYSKHPERCRERGVKPSYLEHVYTKPLDLLHPLEKLLPPLTTDTKAAFGYFPGDTSADFVELAAPLLGVIEAAEPEGITVITNEVVLTFKTGCSSDTIYDLINPLIEAFAE